MLRFLSAICHKRFRCKRAFKEKAQHLRRWISLRTFTRGRLVPRQPRAIKRTTRTGLRGESIRNEGMFHWEFTITPTVLHHEGIYIAKYIHWNTDTKPTALHHYNIRNGGCIHWNASITPTALLRCNIHNAKYIHCNIGITPTVSVINKQFIGLY